MEIIEFAFSLVRSVGSFEVKMPSGGIRNDEEVFPWLCLAAAFPNNLLPRLRSYWRHLGKRVL